MSGFATKISPESGWRMFAYSGRFVITGRAREEGAPKSEDLTGQT